MPPSASKPGISHIDEDKPSGAKKGQPRRLELIVRSVTGQIPFEEASERWPKAVELLEHCIVGQVRDCVMSTMEVVVTPFARESTASRFLDMFLDIERSGVLDNDEEGLVWGPKDVKDTNRICGCHAKIQFDAYALSSMHFQPLERMLRASYP